MFEQVKYPDKVANGGINQNGKVMAQDLNEIKRTINGNALLSNQLSEQIKNVGQGLIFMGSAEPPTLVFSNTQYLQFKSQYPNNEPFWIAQGGVYNSGVDGLNYSSDTGVLLFVVRNNNGFNVSEFGTDNNVPKFINVTDQSFDSYWGVVNGRTIFMKDGSYSGDQEFYIEEGLGGPGECYVINRRTFGDLYIRIGDGVIPPNTGGHSIITNGTAVADGVQFKIKVKPFGRVYVADMNGSFIINGDLI